MSEFIGPLIKSIQELTQKNINLEKAREAALNNDLADSALLEELGIKIDLMMPVPNGLQYYDTLQAMILAAEEHECDEIQKHSGDQKSAQG